MSIISFFLIFLLCLCMQACNARHSKALISGSALQSQILFKDDKDITFNADSVQRVGTKKSLSISILEDAKELKATSSRVTKPVLLKELAKGFSHVLPNNKENDTGIFSDYSRPHTRPPSHN